MNAIASGRVYAVFFVSGASGLVYQVLWSRWLGLIFGNTTASVALILASFMGGLALGSALASRALPRLQNPLRVYAVVEAGIGLFALAFPLTSFVVESVFGAVVNADSAPAMGLTVRAVLSFLLLLVPTALMGATLPLLTEFFRRNPRASAGWKVGVLYTANTIGAAAGVLVSSMLLIELVGIRATTMVAALLNIAVASVAWRFAREASASEPMSSAPPPTTAASTSTSTGEARAFAAPRASAAVLVLAGTGALAMAAEVLWTRTLTTWMGASTYAFSCIVFVFLLGIAGGAWAMSAIVERIRSDLRLAVLVALVVFLAVWMTASVPLFRLLTTTTAAGGMASMSTFLWLYVKAGSLLVPLAIASGACFPLATRVLTPVDAHDASGRDVARAYAWNTVGSVAGSLGAGFLIAPRTDFAGALFVVAVGYGAWALLCALWIRRWLVASAALVSTALATFSLVGSEPYDAPAYARRGIDVVSHRPGMQGVTTVLRQRGEPLALGLLVNGMGMTLKVTDTKMMAHLPLLVHPAPKETLVICFGMGTTFRSALSHGGNVTAVELVEEVLDAFPYFYADAPAVLANPRGRRIVNDGRNFLALTDQRFDVITIDPPPPIDAAGVNNLYSRDFFELARDHLNEGGIFAHWIPLAGTASGVDDQRTYQMLIDSFAVVFPHTYAVKSQQDIGLHLLGSMRPIVVDEARIAARISVPDVSRDLNEFDRVPFEKIIDVIELPPPEPDALVTTDDHPLLEFFFLRSALSGTQKAMPAHSW